MPSRLPLTDTPAMIADESRNQLAEALFSSIGDGAIATDEFGKITRVNPMTTAILGYSEKELIGAWFPKRIVSVEANGEPTSLIDRPITRAFLTGRTISEKMFYQRKDKSLIPVTITVAPVMLGGKPVGAVEVFRDISLEQEVDRMKSDFISLASHQLRTPLSAIKTYSHMMIDGFMGDLTPAQSKSLRTIVSAANRMNELISTLLNVTRIESGTVAITPKMIDVPKVVEEICKEHELSAQDREVSISSQVSTKLPPMKTDLLLYKEILSNLVSNAIKYTPNGGQVEISVKSRGPNILASVSDTGLGIPRRAQEQIFSKFFRAPNVVKQETSGTGLGLYLVKGLVDALGGKIWFDSREGKGTTFYVSMPKVMNRG